MQVYRHRLITRIWHWVNALAVMVLIGSGLMIFNAHPRLYWGRMARITIPPGSNCRAGPAG